MRFYPENRRMNTHKNCVYLVGAGPGDPDLLTVKAMRLIASADVVVYDNLVGAAIVDAIPASARRIFVGKSAGRHTLCQEKINQLLVELGQAGGTVVRLKGGDPYVFGRGGEEAEALCEKGLAFEVVPGITAAIGMSAYAGIPLTHRDHAQSCTFVTGHMKAGKLDLDWSCLAKGHQTLVVYMGIGALDEICTQLIAHGKAADTPAAIVRNATLGDQATHCGTLGTITGICRAAGIEPPALLVVGDVVKLQPTLNWYEGN